MEKYIPLDALVAEIERQKAQWRICKSSEAKYRREMLDDIRSFLNTLEVKEVDLGLITSWFDHVAQIADDRMTLTNQRMTDAHALDEIKCLAKNSSEFITKHYKAQKGK